MADSPSLFLAGFVRTKREHRSFRWSYTRQPLTAGVMRSPAATFKENRILERGKKHVDFVLARDLPREFFEHAHVALRTTTTHLNSGKPHEFPIPGAILHLRTQFGEGIIDKIEH